MILGIGSDLVDIRRVEALHGRFGERLLTRLLTGPERDAMKEGARNQTLAARLAKRIAAKEAAAKALGTGIGQGVRWQDFEVLRDGSGKPSLAFNGMARRKLYQKLQKGDKPALHLSLSDDYPYALAFVVIETT